MRHTIPAHVVRTMRDRWPCSGLPNRSLWYEEDGNGDICDLSEWTRDPRIDCDGAAIVALVTDHQSQRARKLGHALRDAFRTARQPEPFTSVPCERCGHTDRTQCEHGHRLAQLAESVCNPEDSP